MHVGESIGAKCHENRIDPDKRCPMIMSLQEFHRSAPKKIVIDLGIVALAKLGILDCSVRFTPNKQNK